LIEADRQIRGALSRKGLPEGEIDRLMAAA
jgi:hypothetical protein